MKGRDSGMPAEDYWETFFDAAAATPLLLGSQTVSGDIVEFGCGYGSFTIPAARAASGVVTALDIDADMIKTVRQKAAAGKLANIRVEKRDFVANGTGLPTGSQSHAMIYNLLHIEHPEGLLDEARRVLEEGGSLSVMHWRSDIPTPRGPSLDIRPTPDQCRTWMLAAGFSTVDDIELGAYCPYHFGLRAV